MEITVCDCSVRKIPELIHALFDSAERFFRRGGYELLTDNSKEPQLLAFLCDLGYQQMARDCYAQVWQMKNEGDRFTEIMSMLEVIAGNDTEEETLVRTFYRDFGPVGIARYVQKLASGPKEIYRPLNGNGKQRLEAVTRFVPQEGKTVPELRRIYSPLIDRVRWMRVYLEDNPYDILAGTHGNGDILCVNLKGCFGFWLYETAAPLGFEGWICCDGGDGL